MMIKVCGMKEEDNVRDVGRLFPTLMGFIFYRKSHRYAGDLNPDAVKTLPECVTPVGVFVDANEEEIEGVCSRYGIKTVQLHGSETPELCRRLKERGYSVFKAAGISSDYDWKALTAYTGTVDMFVFDTKCAGHGGSGKKFDWAQLENYPFATPYLLSGGIGPDDTEAIAKAVRPGMVGIDLNSAFETEPGIKDIKKLKDFITNLKTMNKNRLQSLFERKGQNLLSVYFTAGYPSLESTGEIMESLATRGVDMIEVGVPFSDPMADGAVIQKSSTEALRNGMNLHLLLDQVEKTRDKIGDTPLVLMGYLNPMWQFGIEKLFKRCKEAGIDALIIPDLPFDEYLNEYKPLCDKYDIPMIMLITPETSEERIRLIDEHCSGFIYMVSAASTTGTRDSFGKEQLDYFHRVNSMPLRHKRLIGFGISNQTTLNEAWENSSGAIIGSLFIKCLDAHPGYIPAAVDTLLETLGQ